MEARVYIQPLESAEGSYQSEVQVNNDILPRLRVSQRLNKNKWSVGLLYPTLDSITLANEDGRYNPSSSSRSIFAFAGADRARVRIEYPLHVGSSTYQTIYRGLISTKSSTLNPQTGKATWKTRTPDSAIVNQRLNAGLVTNGMTTREAIEAVFTDLEIAGAFPGGEFSPGRPAPGLSMDNYFDPNRTGTIIRNETALLGESRNADDVLEKLLIAGDNFLTYVPYIQQARVMRRAELSSPDFTRIPWSSGYVDNPLEIQAIEGGVEQIFNVITLDSGVTGEFAQLTEEDRGSISRWGRRQLNLDMSWVQDLDQVQGIAKNLLARLKNPSRVIEVSVPSLAPDVNSPTQVFGRELIVGGLVGVHVPSRSPRSAPRVGVAEVGQAQTQRPTYEAIQGNFYVEEYTRDFTSDTTRMTLREFIEE